MRAPQSSGWKAGELPVKLGAGGVGEWFSRLRGGQVQAAVLKPKIADALSETDLDSFGMTPGQRRSGPRQGRDLRLQLRPSRGWDSGLQPLKLQGLKALFRRSFMSDLPFLRQGKKIRPPTSQSAGRSHTFSSN